MTDTEMEVRMTKGLYGNSLDRQHDRHRNESQNDQGPLLQDSTPGSSESAQCLPTNPNPRLVFLGQRLPGTLAHTAKPAQLNSSSSTS